MSLREELQPIKFPMGVVAKGMALASSGEVLEILSEAHLKRGSGGMLDIASHIGNFTEGSKATMGAGLLIGIFSIMKPCLESEINTEQFKKRARITAIAAFGVSAVVQYVGEKYGLTNGLMKNTPDMIDAAYGVGYSAPIALAGYKLAVSTDQVARKKRQVRKDEWEAWYEANRQTIDDQYNQTLLPQTSALLTAETTP